jgi:FolB domain-containing protein
MVADTIHIHGLKLEVRIGFHEVELNRTQPLRADLSIETDFRHGPQEDRRTGLVDYYELERRLRAHVSDRKYDLLEALAVDLARSVIAAHPSVRVRVRVTKLPLDMPGIEAVSAECVRDAKDFSP